MMEEKVTKSWWEGERAYQVYKANLEITPGEDHI